MGTAERVECLRDLSPAVYKTFELYGNKKRAVDLIFRNLRLFYLLFMTIECLQNMHSIVSDFESCFPYKEAAAYR